MCEVERFEDLLGGDVGSEGDLGVCLLAVVELQEELKVKRDGCDLSVCLRLRPFTWVSFRCVEAFAGVPKCSVALCVCAQCVVRAYHA